MKAPTRADKPPGSHLNEPFEKVWLANLFEERRTTPVEESVRINRTAHHRRSRRSSAIQYSLG
jgi:hypothetical protein